ncbi:MAG: RNA-binding cell elongation regulator Jag/EloR, partial [Chloroflexota bacterium]|nr:RNA-binding cell elongation regulator Jag/EloR [Chloroflexota bacterium]
KTVEEAVEVALMDLGVGREEVEVEVLSRGKTGFLGIGSEPARVRVKRILPSQGVATRSMEVVTKLLRAMNAETTATLRSAEDPKTGGPVIDIQGDDSGLLIGRRGETLRSLQFLVNLMVNKDTASPTRVVLDVEKYKERRYKALEEMALRVAEKVAATGRPITLEPMAPAERRVVHLALADHPRVTTESLGEGSDRRVTIHPRKA